MLVIAFGITSAGMPLKDGKSDEGNCKYDRETQTYRSYKLGKIKIWNEGDENTCICICTCYGQDPIEIDCGGETITFEIEYDLFGSGWNDYLIAKGTVDGISKTKETDHIAAGTWYWDIDCEEGDTITWSCEGWLDEWLYSRHCYCEDSVNIFCIPDADLNCDGQISKSGLEPGTYTINDEFEVENIGYPGSNLNWRVSDCPSWGSFSFDPDSGTNLQPEDGPLTVSVTIQITGGTNDRFSGNIEVENTEDTFDRDTVPVSISFPKWKSVCMNPNFQKLLDQFPILRHMLGL